MGIWLCGTAQTPQYSVAAHIEAGCDQFLKGALEHDAGESKRIAKDLTASKRVLSGGTARRRRHNETPARPGQKRDRRLKRGRGRSPDADSCQGAHLRSTWGAGGRRHSFRCSKNFTTGPDDTPSGTGALIAEARRFGARKEKPRGGLCLRLSPAKESAADRLASLLRRSRCFPLDKTIDMINMDMVGG